MLDVWRFIHNYLFLGGRGFGNAYNYLLFLIIEEFHHNMLTCVILKLILPQTSLVIQWLRICLPMQGTWIPNQERCHMSQGNKSCTLQLLSLCSRACKLQLLKLMCPRDCAPQEKPPQWEVHAPQLRSSPCLPQLEKSPQQWPSTAKNKQNVKKI